MNKDTSIVLDTNVAIAALNENDADLAWLSTFAELLLPVIVLAELRFGAINSAAIEYNLARLSDFRDACIVVDVDEAVATIQAELQFQLHRQGKPIGDNDLWIAGICLSRGLPLATRDTHFLRFPQLSVLHW